jgi:nucleotide sugar dehydrogenase
MSADGVIATSAEDIAAHCADRSGTVAVVGMGKIGLPLAMQYVGFGRRVVGCDINPEVVASLARGECHVHEEPGLDQLVARAVAEGTFTATSDTAAAVHEARIVVVIVPVVVDANHAVDFVSIDAATRAVGAGLRPGTLIIYETTLPVGTTSGRFRPILEEESGLTAGRDFYLAYSPERVLSGRIARDLATYPKVVGGVDPTSTQAVAAFYGSVLDARIISMASADEAEFVKLIETTYRDVNIGLANEYAMYADRHGLDVYAAIAAANTQPYSHIHQPGVGVGGHCIPVYPYFLMHGTTSGLDLPRRARAINDGMAIYAADAIERTLGSLADRPVAILGVAYRGDVKETAFSSAFLLRDALRERGAAVFADDPLYTDDELRALGFTPLSETDISTIQALIVQAAHSAYTRLNLQGFGACQVMVDGRRAFDRGAVEALGMRYISVGDGHMGDNRR